MFHIIPPPLFTEFLEKDSVISKVYDAMEKEDNAEVVLTAMDVLNDIGTMPISFKQEGKSDSRSDYFRTAGNDYIFKNNYSKALECYNKALSHAPKNSRAMKLAYSNRSFVLFKLDAASACIEDIDKCFSMGCPDDIKDKLLKRRAEARKIANMDTMALNTIKVTNNKYFSFPPIGNTSPCTSTDIKIVKNGKELKILAAREINTGTIIASEEAYMTYACLDNQYVSCYFCLQMKANLIPCDNCCYALFCSDKCKIKCFNQYHKFECDMMVLINEVCKGSALNLMIKTVLKLKSEMTWKEFIKASKLVGNNRIKESSVQEIFETSSNCSVLSFRDDQPFVYSKVYDSSFVCGVLLHHLSNLPSFLPTKAPDREEAIRALARTMIYLSINGPPNYVFQVVTDYNINKTHFHDYPNYAWYSFFGKLKTTCIPNVMASFLNNKVVIIATRRIQPGEEITTTLWDPAFENFQFETKDIFLKRGTVCLCQNCKDGIRMDKLSQHQKNVYRSFNMQIAKFEKNSNIMVVSKSFPKVCKTMNSLSDVPHSKEYIDCLHMFRKCLNLFETLETENFIL